MVRTEPVPPLPFEDHAFGAIWAISVFTHLTESWAAWMLELRRVLSPDGVLIATWAGEEMAAKRELDVPWDEQRAGMSICGNGRPFELTVGPNVLLSRWWLEEHWGRAFEILELRPGGFAGSTPGQGVAVMRPRPGPFTEADLTGARADEPREVEGLRYQVETLLAEVADLQASQVRPRSFPGAGALRRVRDWATAGRG